MSKSVFLNPKSADSKDVDESEKLTGTVRVKKRIYDHVADRSV